MLSFYCSMNNFSVCCVLSDECTLNFTVLAHEYDDDDRTFVVLKKKRRKISQNKILDDVWLSQNCPFELDPMSIVVEVLFLFFLSQQP